MLSLKQYELNFLKNVFHISNTIDKSLSHVLASLSFVYGCTVSYARSTLAYLWFTIQTYTCRYKFTVDNNLCLRAVLEDIQYIYFTCLTWCTFVIEEVNEIVSVTRASQIINDLVWLYLSFEFVNADFTRNPTKLGRPETTNYLRGV